MVASFADKFLNLFNGTPSNVMDADPITFERLIANQAPGKFYLLDVRTPSETNQGMLPGAKLISWSNRSDFENETAKLDKKLPVYVYCRSGMRSSRAAKALDMQGFQVTNLLGGIVAWEKAGFPVK